MRNGSFENIVPPANWNTWSGQFINFSETPVKIILPDWSEYNSADLLPSACTHTYSGAPKNLFGFCNAKDGNNYCGIITFIGNGNKTKEYIFQHLTQPLQAGKIYCLSFYVSRADISYGAIKNIGAYFSNNVLSTGSLGYISVTPQIVNQSGFITDTVNWVQIQGCFTANGGEQYITIGNFNSNANTDTIYTGSNYTTSNGPYYSYYYIDDITLIDQTTVRVNEIEKENSFEVYPNPNNGSMQINYSITKKAELAITDITGRIVNTYILEETQQSVAINEHELNSGIYFYSVKQNNIVLKQDKFVIVK
ncbi:MAG: T9SS type A sorting domain-containing protein [Bacteroidota bacterium]